MCEGRVLIAVDRDGVEGACGGCEVLPVGLLTRPRLDCGCHQGQPLVGFPWFSLRPKQPRVSLFGMVPAGLEPSTGLLGLVGHLGVVSWSKG